MQCAHWLPSQPVSVGASHGRVPKMRKQFRRCHIYYYLQWDTGALISRLSRLAPELTQLDHNPAFSFVNEKATSYKARSAAIRPHPFALLLPKNRRISLFTR